MGDYMNYKLVVLDLDGTLLDDEKQISEKNLRILNELHKRKIEIIIATGRNYYMAKILTDKIKNVEPVIMANNGAIVRRSNNDELIEYNYLSFLEFEKIYNEGLKLNLNPVVHVDEYSNGYDLIYEREDFEQAYLGYIKKDYNRARLMKFMPESMGKILSVCYFNEYDKLRSFGDEMKNKSMGKFNTICNRNISKRALLEFLNPDGCKWSALKRYAASINVKKDEIIAIGDDNNDIELLRNAGLSFAMKNGTKESIEAANKVTKHTNNESGVYYALSEVFQVV